MQLMVKYLACQKATEEIEAGRVKKILRQREKEAKRKRKLKLTLLRISEENHSIDSLKCSLKQRYSKPNSRMRSELRQRTFG